LYAKEKHVTGIGRFDGGQEWWNRTYGIVDDSLDRDEDSEFRRRHVVETLNAIWASTRCHSLLSSSTTTNQRRLKISESWF
jgi:hypothetical protein